MFFKGIQDSPPLATAQPCEDIFPFIDANSVTCRGLSFLTLYSNIPLFIQQLTSFEGIIWMNEPALQTQ